MAYSLQDLDDARAELKRWQERWENYDGNNPNKYQADIRIARQKVSSIEYDLKQQGLLPK
jgi:hypothetical protein